MGKVATIRLMDDLNGGEANNRIEFGYEGKIYEIDLNDPNNAALRDGLLPFVSVARQIGSWSMRQKPKLNVKLPVGAKPTRREIHSSTASNLPKSVRQDIREWGRKRGLKVKERGRIEGSVVEAYLSEHGLDDQGRPLAS